MENGGFPERGKKSFIPSPTTVNISIEARRKKKRVEGKEGRAAESDSDLEGEERNGKMEGGREK